MKRKDFLKLSSFASVAISFPFFYSCNSATPESLISQPVFLSGLFDENTINEVGKAYLQKTPTENDQNKIVQLLTKQNAVANSTDKKAINEYLEKEIQQDFSSGNTVIVKGWVLSHTEARQCALFSLLNN